MTSTARTRVQSAAADGAAIRPFGVDVPQAELDELRRRIAGFAAR